MIATTCLMKENIRSASFAQGKAAHFRRASEQRLKQRKVQSEGNDFPLPSGDWRSPRRINQTPKKGFLHHDYEHEDG